MFTDSTAVNPPPVEPRRYWQIPVFLLGLVAAYFAYQHTPARNSGASPNASGFDELRAALDRKSNDAAAIEPLLRNIGGTATTTPEQFLVGSGYLAMADMAPSENTDYWSAAAKALEQCDASKLENPNDAPKLAYRLQLAKAAIGTGDPNEILRTLQSPPPGEQRIETTRLIAKTAIRTNPPNRTLAKEQFAKYLSGQNRASTAVTSQCKLELARLHIHDRENDKARTWLNDLLPTAPTDVQALAKAHLGQLALIESNWPEAVKQYEAALLSPTLTREERATIRYQTGVALLNNGNDAAAVPYLLQTANEPGAVGGAAALKLAAIRGREPTLKGVRSEAADWLEKAVLHANGSSELKAPELRTSCEEIIKISSQEGDYPTALRAATVYAKVAESNLDRKHRAEICEQWANNLLKTNPADAKAKFVDSATEYTALAETILDPTEKAQTLRKAALQLRQAGENSKAAELVSATLNIKGLPEAAVAKAWLDRADLLPADRTEEIEAALAKVIALPGPTATEARCKLGLTYIKRSQDLMAGLPNSTQPDELKVQATAVGKLGRDLLTQIADSSSVSMDESSNHELALFELGRLAMLDQKYADAEARLRKQLTLYGTGTHADNARLWIASVLLEKARTNGSDAPKARAEALVYLKELSKSPHKFLQTWGEIWQANTLLQSGDNVATIALSKELMTKHSGKLEELVAGKLLIYAYLATKPAEISEAQKTLTRMEELFQTLPREAYRTDAEYSYDHWKAELPKLRDMVKR